MQTNKSFDAEGTEYHYLHSRVALVSPSIWTHVSLVHVSMSLPANTHHASTDHSFPKSTPINWQSVFHTASCFLNSESCVTE